MIQRTVHWLLLPYPLGTAAVSLHASRHLLWCAGCSPNWTTAKQAELGDIVYVEMPEVGSQMESGAVFGVVESVKVCSSLAQHWPDAGD